MISDRLVEEIVTDTATLLGIAPGAEFDQFSKKYMESIDVVSDDNQFLGVLPRGLVHRLGLRHRVVYAAILDDHGRMLLQTRGSGRLDIAVGGHVQAGEQSLPSALGREFEEELGVKPALDQFHHLVTYKRDAPINPKRPLERNRELRFVFTYLMTSHQIKILSNAFLSRKEQEEVSDYRWVNRDEFIISIENGNVADGLRETAKYLLEIDGFV